jgi:sulfite exporter TauE/SafE
MFWTALVLGFAGSLHCVGMCSPLAMAVTNMSPQVMLSRILYNGGRILTYGLLGGIVASVGLGFPLTHYQNLLSILLGISLVVIGFSGVTSIRIPFVTDALRKLSSLVKKLFSKYIQKKTRTSTFILGSLNGILPCGLSFLALTYCLTLGGPADGFVFMTAFGLGTLPAMLGFTSFFYWITRRFKFSITRLTTGMLILSGLLLIGRVFFIHLPHARSVQDGIVDIVLCR